MKQISVRTWLVAAAVAVGLGGGAALGLSGGGAGATADPGASGPTVLPTATWTTSLSGDDGTGTATGTATATTSSPPPTTSATTISRPPTTASSTRAAPRTSAPAVRATAPRTSPPRPQPPHDRISAAGWYGPLHIGMSTADAVGTGWVMPDVRGHDGSSMTCTNWQPDRFAQAGVWMSGDRGIESMIFDKPGVRTSLGVQVGTPWAQMLKAYRGTGLKRDREFGRAWVSLPGSPASILRFDETRDEKVATITVQRTDQRCYE